MSQYSQASTEEPYTEDSPNPYDVYLGRGNAVNQNSGNRIYRSTIKQNKARYFEAKGHEGKGRIAKNVIKSFLEMGGTFYYKQGTAWEEAPIEIVLKKVKQALREKGIKKATRDESRPSSRISSRGQMSRRGTTASRSFPTAAVTSSPSSLGAKPQGGEKVLVTRLDGSVVDAVSLYSSFPQTSLAPTSQQPSEDKYPIDSGHWRRLRFQSKNKYTNSMIDRLSVASFSTTMTAESFKSPSTMQSNNDTHTSFLLMDQQSTHMTQTMATDHKTPEMKQQLSTHLSEGLGLGLASQNLMSQDQILSNQHGYANTVSNHDITGQTQTSDCPLPELTKDTQQMEGMASYSSTILTSDSNPQLPPQEQINFSIPVRKGENVQVDLSYMYGETKSLHGSNMNSSNIQNSLMQGKMDSIAPSGQENDMILEGAENMDDEVSSDLTNVDVMEYIDGTNYRPQNESMMYDNVNFEGIFEETSGRISNSKCLNDQNEPNSMAI